MRSFDAEALIVALPTYFAGFQVCDVHWDPVCGALCARPNQLGLHMLVIVLSPG